MSRVRIFLAMSLDGFIAGPADELDWLEGFEGVEDTFTPFMAEVGAMLMGRRTYDVLSGFDVPWPYGETPLLVATTRPLQPVQPTVRAVTGDIAELVAQARAAAGGKDVYLDGGALARSALDAGLVDLMTLTLIPVVLGAGVPLFAGAGHRHALTLVSARPIGGGFVSLQYATQR